MLSAMSFVLFLLEFPITPPAMGHLKMDFSDIPALFAGIVFGPMYSVVVELVKNLLELLTKGMGTQMGFGNLMNFAVGCAYTVPFSLIIRRNQAEMKKTKNIVIAAVVSFVSIIVIGVAGNYFIAPLYFKYFVGTEIDSAGLLAAVGTATVLNVLKGVMLSIVAFPLVKAMVGRIKKIAGKL